MNSVGRKHDCTRWLRQTIHEGKTGEKRKRRRDMIEVTRCGGTRERDNGTEMKWWVLLQRVEVEINKEIIILQNYSGLANNDHESSSYISLLD